MVDTRRTRTDLKTNLFQDGQANDEITANDVRDIIESMMVQDDLESKLFAEVFGSRSWT